MSIPVKRKRLAISLLTLLAIVGGLLARQWYLNQRVAAILKPCMAAVRANSYTAGLPCYERALRYEPNNQALEMVTAYGLVCTGDYNDARSHFRHASSEIGLLSNEAKRMLEPGAMQQYKAGVDNMVAAQRDYMTLDHEYAQEEMDYQATYNTETEPYRTRLRQMVATNVFKERKMMIARGVWNPSVLQQPYYRTNPH